MRNTWPIILVEPADSLNIGSAARAMKNLGFSTLRLVAPREYEPKRASITAVWAYDVVSSVEIFPTLRDALHDCDDAVGFSGRAGPAKAGDRRLPDWIAELETDPVRRTGLVFGPEDSGLTNEHLEQCRLVVRIPAAVEYPSFNLAQAVLLVLWEVSRLAPPPDQPPSAPPVRWSDFAQLDRLLDQVMERTGFVRPGSPAPVPAVLRNLFRRTLPDTREFGILLGFLGRIDRTITWLSRRSPDEGSLPPEA